MAFDLTATREEEAANAWTSLARASIDEECGAEALEVATRCVVMLSQLEPRRDLEVSAPHVAGPRKFQLESICDFRGPENVAHKPRKPQVDASCGPGAATRTELRL